MRRLESPRAICDCMAALVQGDLASKGSAQPNHADNLLPLTPQGARLQRPASPGALTAASPCTDSRSVGAGEPVENKMEWLADVVVALLQRARELGLADWAAQRSRPVEGLAVPEGLAWRDCFATFFDLLSRHLNTLAEVKRLALEVQPAHRMFPSVVLQVVGFKSGRWPAGWGRRGSKLRQADRAHHPDPCFSAARHRDSAGRDPGHPPKAHLSHMSPSLWAWGAALLAMSNDWGWWEETFLQESKNEMCAFDTGVLEIVHFLPACALLCTAVDTDLACGAVERTHNTRDV